MINNEIIELAKSCNAKLINPNSKHSEFKSLCHDTRNINENTIFIALRGNNYDGHDFLKDAFMKGAVGAIVNNKYDGNFCNLIKVPDTLKALQIIGINNRSNWKGISIGITGSAGKTTVKELCSCILSTKFSTHKNVGNFNNHIGLPLTLIELNENHNYLIAEIGMNKPGEIETLTKWLQPDISIITEIGLAHVKNFSSINDIANEKSYIIRNLTKDKTSILDIDNTWYNYLINQTKSNILSVSLINNGQINGIYDGFDKLKVDGYTFKMPSPGEFMARNVIKAIALGKLLGLNNKEIEHGISVYQPLQYRWNNKVIKNITWINDAYNANPLSMKSSIEAFSIIKSNRKCVVLGKMDELGAFSYEEHLKLFKFVDSLNFDMWITIGDWEDDIFQNLKGKCFKNIKSALEFLQNWSMSGDHILLKASRSEKFEEFLINL